MVVRTIPAKTADAKTIRMMQVRMQKDNANAIERFENAAMDRRVQVSTQPEGKYQVNFP